MQDVTHCPQCHRRVLLPPELVGQLVQCPGCWTTFTAGKDDRPTAPSRPEAIPPRANYERWDEPLRIERPAVRPDWDDYEDEPNLRRDPRRPRRKRSEAIATVSGPGTALQVVGAIATGLSVIILLIQCTGGFGGGMRHRDPLAEFSNAFGGVMAGILGLCWGLVILLGSSKMKSLSNYGSAMTAAIVALIPCSACWVLGLPFGIWALVTLSRPDVKEAFSAERMST